MPTVSFNTQLPDYEVLAELGRGNTRVLKARHLPTGDIVAIKQYAFATDTDTLRRFERESQIMTRINHPNVVRVREVQLGAAMPYVVMDFVEGGDLRGLLKQTGSLDLPTTLRLGLQLTEAFRAMHPLDVVHRDVKPENVLYRRLASGELHFLLTDFGIAKLRADDTARTRTGQSLMTYEYAAPEQFDNPRHVDEAADYYALGAVLYECLTGHVPFVLHDENGLGGFMNQVLTAPIPAPLLPSGQPLPPSLGTLLMALLARNPQARLRHPDQLELLLEQSRVEQLQANRLGQLLPPPTTTRTVAGPVYVPTNDDAAYDEPEEPEQIGGQGVATWLGIAGIVFAVGVALFLFFSESQKTAAVAPPSRIDSTQLMQPQPADTDTITPATNATPLDARPLEEEQPADSQTDNVPESQPEPVQNDPQQTSTDTTLIMEGDSTD